MRYVSVQGFGRLRRRNWTGNGSRRQHPARDDSAFLGACRRQRTGSAAASASGPEASKAEDAPRPALPMGADGANSEARERPPQIQHGRSARRYQKAAAGCIAFLCRQPARQSAHRASAPTRRRNGSEEPQATGAARLSASAKPGRTTGMPAPRGQAPACSAAASAHCGQRRCAFHRRLDLRPAAEAVQPRLHAGCRRIRGMVRHRRLAGLGHARTRDLAHQLPGSCSPARS